MRVIWYTGLVLFSCISCSLNRGSDSDQDGLETTIKFDREKWSLKEDSDYPYRNLMLNDVLYNDTIRSLNKEEILGLLGEPDRTTEDHLYYKISQKRIGSWTLHQKSLVIKIANDSTVEWIKTHG